MLQELLEKSRHNHLPGCFPWISQDPRHFYGYIFGKSFVHPATQTGATQIKLTALDCPLPLEKDPKDFSRSPAMVFFVTNLANYPPPHRKSKSTCPLKRNYFKRNNTSNHRFSGDMLVFGGSISLTFGWWTNVVKTQMSVRTLCLVL